MKISGRVSHPHFFRNPGPEAEGLCSRLPSPWASSLCGEGLDVPINRGIHCGWLLGVSGDSNTSIREALM